MIPALGRKDPRSIVGATGSRPDAEVEIGDHVEFLDIEIRLVESVKQNQCIGARLAEAVAATLPIDEKYGFIFTAIGMSIVSAKHRDDVKISSFDIRRGHTDICRNEVDIDLEGICTGLFDLAGILDPAFGSDAVETGDDRGYRPGPWPCG